MLTKNSPERSPLGKKISYIDTYAPRLLYSIPRKEKREEIGIASPLPFKGVDIWNAHDTICFLNTKGKPCIAMGEFIVPCNSTSLFESKSLKLYLNSFSQTQFESIEAVKTTLENDLLNATGGVVLVNLTLPNQFSTLPIVGHLEGESLDEQDFFFDTYDLQPDFLETKAEKVSETLCSDLLKSNCLVTGQADIGSIQITYTGKKIDRAGLLKYIVSFRKHSGFAEHCVERIFMDIMQRCAPEKLSIYIRYTRRGGIDINPYRSTEEGLPQNIRLCRQ
jgi:7-cyano-7-deazaguanine reductase